jgi:signal transduction histidine kinase
MTPPEEPAPLAEQDGLEAFAALAAHQLGEAIALMRGAASVLEGEQLGPGGQEALRALGAGGDRAQRYVDDLLDVVRARSAPVAAAGGDDPAETPRAQLDAALDDVLAELDPFLRRTAVQVQREPLPDAALERADARRLFLHFTRAALAAGATRLGATGRVEGARAIVELYDNGTPHSDPATAFAPFAHPRGRGPLVGAGVSLPVSRRLAERAGGSVAMVVRADGATVVTLELPAV